MDVNQHDLRNAGGTAPDQSASRLVQSISTEPRHLTPVSLGSGDAAKELAS